MKLSARSLYLLGAVFASSGLIARGAHAQCTPTWTAYPGPQLDNGVYGLTVWDPDGPGPLPSVIVAGGNFERAGGTQLNFVGLWNGSAWQPMSKGLNGTVKCAAAFDPDGSGPVTPRVIVGGYFTLSAGAPVNRIAAFDGSQWHSLANGVGGQAICSVSAMIIYDLDLVVSGTFPTASGIQVGGIARWDGVSWHAFPDERAGSAEALAIHAGSLYAGAHFQTPSPPPLATSVLHWNNSTWTTIGSNFPQDDVYAITSYRGQLIVGGNFTNQCCGNPPAPGERVAAFNGISWQPLGAGFNGTVRALCVFDPDGAGPLPDLLIAGGNFTAAGGQPAHFIAAWDGAQWSPLASGTTGTVRALTVWDSRLVVAGEFFSAGGLASPGMAFWGCPTLPCYPNCDASALAPILNVNDFICFLNRFAAGDSYANCDNSTSQPTLNIADFICYMNRFAAGCP